MNVSVQVFCCTYAKPRCGITTTSHRIDVYLALFDTAEHFPKNSTIPFEY